MVGYKPDEVNNYVGFIFDKGIEIRKSRLTLAVGIDFITKSIMKRILHFIGAVVLLSTVIHPTSICLAQNTMLTYQGRVTDNGADFNGTGQFEFALVTSSNANHTATATANAPSGGFITSYNVGNAGNGYVSAPTVTIFGGGGSGAAAHANISGGAVTSLSVDNPGDGHYTNAPAVVIAAPPPNISYVTYWSNDGTGVNGSEPAAAVDVVVSNGLFTVTLGDTTIANMAAISASLFAQPNLQLRIWFDDGTNGFAALDPAQNLTPTPYATVAQNLNNGLSIQQNSDGAPDVVAGSSVNYVSNGVVGATIAGGGAVNYNGLSYTNSVTANFGTVSGGYGNTASGFTATVSGGIFNAAENAGDTVGGGSDNIANGGGQPATVGGGYLNNAIGAWSTVGGGFDNSATNEFVTVGGGYNNTASGGASMVGGGSDNVASGGASTVGGGLNNSASGSSSTVGGGSDNVASGTSATVSGGDGNVASGNYSFAAGNGAQAPFQGDFVWADDNGGAYSATAANQFAVRAIGGVILAADVQLAGGNAYHNLSLSGGNATGYLYGSYPKFGDGIHLGYNYYAGANGGDHISNAGGATSRLTAGYGFVEIDVGGVNAAPTTQRFIANSTGVSVFGTFNNTSDRNAKQDFAPVSSAQILDEVTRLPISEWSYKTDAGTRHIGPMGQDFYSIFNIGTDEKHIAPIDEGGVALAAIQGLNRKMETEEQTKDSEIRSLKEQNDLLSKRLADLAAEIKSLAQKNGAAAAK